MLRRYAAVVGGVLWLAGMGAAQSTGAGAFLAGPGTRGALLNGQPLLPGTAILPGETVTTGADGIVVLTPAGGSGGAVELTGNASATVEPAAAGGKTAPLDLHQGEVLVYGPVAVHTPQDTTLRPQTVSTRYVIEAGPVLSRLAVLAGAIDSLHASATVPVPQGEARSWNASGTMQTIPLAQVHPPQPTDAMTKLVPASVSR